MSTGQQQKKRAQMKWISEKPDQGGDLWKYKGQELSRKGRAGKAGNMWFRNVKEKRQQMKGGRLRMINCFCARIYCGGRFY